MTRFHFLSIAFVLTALPAPAHMPRQADAATWTAPTPPACREDAPIAAIAASEGPMGPRNVLVAVWDDGRIIRSLSEKSPGAGYARARLSAPVMEEVRATLLRMRYWKWPPSKLGIDFRLQMTLACVEGREATFEHRGRPSASSGPGQLRDYLMRLRLPAPVRAEAPLPEDWLRWFHAGEAIP